MFYIRNENIGKHRRAHQEYKNQCPYLYIEYQKYNIQVSFNHV